MIAVDGLDAAATAACAALVAGAIRARGIVVTETAEPTDSPTGRRVAEVLADPAGVEPETAALLSAADRAEHVAVLIGPALERGEVVVCDRFVLTSLALHGAGRGAEVERVRAVNAWSTGELPPDLTLVVASDTASAALSGGLVDVAAARQALLDEAEIDPRRNVRCAPGPLPVEVSERLERLVASRASLLAAITSGAGR